MTRDWERMTQVLGISHILTYYVHMYLRTWNNESFLIYRHDINRNQTSMINQILQTFATEFAAIFFFKNLSWCDNHSCSSFCTYTWTYIRPNLHIKEMKFAIAIFKTFRLHLHDFRLWNQVCSRRSKGQLISEWLLDAFIWTKKRTKIFLYFCPTSLK